MTATIHNFQVARVMVATVEAYRRAAYGEVQWGACAALLLELGYSVEIAVALMESRLMRWTQDVAEDYDVPTVADLARFLASSAGVNAVAYELAA